MQHLCIGLFLVLSFFHCLHTQTPPPEPHPSPEPHPNPVPGVTPNPAPHVVPAPVPQVVPVPAPHVVPEPVPHVVPTPEPHVAPQPHVTPEPTPEPHVAPQPHITPEPTPEVVPMPEPHIMPEPTPEVTPMPGVVPMPQVVPSPQPGPVPVKPTLPDFVYESVTPLNITGYSGLSKSAVLLSGNNDTLTFYGGINQDGVPITHILQYSVSEMSWSTMDDKSNISLEGIHSFSQAPPDSMTYPLFLLRREGSGTNYTLSKADETNFSVMDIISFVIDEMDGLSIAANPSGKVYIFGGKSNNVWMVDTSASPVTFTSLNATNPPEPRKYAALVGYGNGFILHGGMVGNNSALSAEVWQFSTDADNKNTWTYITSTTFSASGHSAVVSILPGANNTIYFAGLSEDFVMAYDITNNVTYHPITSTMKPDARSYSSIAAAGNRIFITGGQKSESANMTRYYNDGYQLVNEKYCYSQSECDACVSYDGCSWCSSPIASANPYYCVAGNGTRTFISGTCAADNVMKMIEHCPELFPSWAIALIVIGGVVIIGVIVFGIMKLRGTKSGYDPVS